MSFALKLIIGKSIIGKSSDLSNPEPALSTKRYKDGSGFMYLKDAKGNVVSTGRTETWFQDMVRLELCNIGSGHLSNLVTATEEKAKEDAKTKALFFFSDDGNTKIKEDRYGAPFRAVSVKKVLDAIQADQPSSGPYKYRRFTWAIALLKILVKDTEDLEVLFFGH